MATAPVRYSKGPNPNPNPKTLAIAGRHHGRVVYTDPSSASWEQTFLGNSSTCIIVPRNFRLQEYYRKRMIQAAEFQGPASSYHWEKRPAREPVYWCAQHVLTDFCIEYVTCWPLRNNGKLKFSIVSDNNPLFWLFTFRTRTGLLEYSYHLTCTTGVVLDVKHVSNCNILHVIMTTYTFNSDVSV